METLKDMLVSHLMTLPPRAEKSLRNRGKSLISRRRSAHSPLASALHFTTGCERRSGPTEGVRPGVHLRRLEGTSISGSDSFGGFRFRSSAWRWTAASIRPGRTILHAIVQHPVHLLFLAHPLLFGLVFGAMGTVRHRLEEKNAELIRLADGPGDHRRADGLHNRR
jgi:hypothetical protein